MVLKVSLVIVLGVLSALTGRTMPLPNSYLFRFEDDGYIKPDNYGKPWTDAQSVCKKRNSTLPIVDSPARQRSFVSALYYFRLNGTADVWLGANAHNDGPGNWRWLDGRKYSGIGVQGAGEYKKSYAFLSRNSTLVSAYASDPTEPYSYICQYNTTTPDVCANGTGLLTFFMESRCYVKYDDIRLSWFNARNKCLENNGDLASFIDISLLNGIVDTNGSWVGLRHSQWNWQNAVTGLSSDVTFTSWSSDQPNDATPTCISVNYDNFPNWKDWNCSLLSQYICQVFNETNVVPFEEPPIDEQTTTAVQKDASGSAGNGSGYKVNVPLAIGLAVGLGGAAIIAIIVIIIVVVVRKHRSSRSIGNSKSGETNASENGRMSPEEEATEINETGNQTQLDNVSTDYATVQEAIGLENENESQLESSSTNQGPVYADLGFGQGSS